MTRTRWTAELIPEMLSRQMIIGRKKNFATEANMKPLKRSKVRFLLRWIPSFENDVSVRMIVKNERFAESLDFDILILDLEKQNKNLTQYDLDCWQIESFFHVERIPRTDVFAESNLTLVKCLHKQTVTLEKSNNHQNFVKVLAASIVQYMTLRLGWQKNQINDYHQTFEFNQLVSDILALLTFCKLLNRRTVSFVQFLQSMAAIDTPELKLFRVFIQKL